MVTSMEKPYVVGMDIGGTNTVFGIVDQRGNVLATDSVKTQSYAKIEEYVEAVTSKLLPLIESVGGEYKTGDYVRVCVTACTSATLLGEAIE